MPRLTISTLMIAVAVAALAAWNWVLFAGMDAGWRLLILAMAGLLAVFPLMALAEAGMTGRTRPTIGWLTALIAFFTLLLGGYACVLRYAV
jgi:hypothetical protein